METNQKRISLASLFGPHLQRKRGLVGTQFVYDQVSSDFLMQVPLLAIYLSANWCPPCKGFLPFLNRFYIQANSEPDSNIQQQKKKTEQVNMADQFTQDLQPILEVVVVSMDSSKDQFEEHVNDIPKNWFVIPYGDERIKRIKETFDVIGIPQLIILDAKQEKVLEINARKKVFEDSEGNGGNCLKEWINDIISNSL
ncbi:hypothetical protein FGO68_gene10668 [Halteria grandinella]|uniref:Thioredoxin-like fold domain-containing protein n=1 Tax=Halteria grandinella TaxID=5974 RepID=A0A8J8T285_HALGN|nr:hypothetical protein FGO68_gene10668 [Halteria grandinella]